MDIGNAIDRVIGTFAPNTGLKRMAARRAMTVVKAAYQGASRDRLRKGWNPATTSANREIELDLKTLRSRARDLNQNDGTAAGLTSTLVANIVGAGSNPQARVDADALGWDEGRAELFNTQAEAAWNRFAERADVTDQMTFAACEGLALRQTIESGEYIAAIEVVDRAIKLNFVEPDRLDLTLNRKPGEGGNEIRMGVEVDRLGMPTAYHIMPNHPGDIRTAGNNAPVAFKRRNDWRLNVLHGYRLDRPGQVRGVPWFAPVLTLFKDFADYMEAERVAARVAACFSIFIQKMDPTAAASGFSSGSEPGPDPGTTHQLEALEAGMIQYLGVNEQPVSFSPNRPGNTFDQFVMRLLRQMAACVDVPYELISKDFSQSNYSNMRGALLEARRVFKMHQKWLEAGFCQPIYERVIEMAVLRGEIDAPRFYANRAAYCRVRWIHPGWNWVDPEKEIAAAIMAIDAGLSSSADECASNGRDWEEVADQRDRERSRKRRTGAENKKEFATTVELLARAGLKADADEVGAALGLSLSEAPPPAQQQTANVEQVA